MWKKEKYNKTYMVGAIVKHYILFGECVPLHELKW